MRFTRLFLMVIVLLQLALASQAAQPKVGIIYFLPSDRTAQSNIDSKIDTLIKATQTAYSNEMNADGYGAKTFTFEKDDSGNAVVHHVTGDHTDSHYLTADGWDVWDEITTAGYAPSQNIYIAFLDFSSEKVGGGWCGTGGDWLDGSLGGVVNMAVASDCFDGNHGTAILVHELGHAFGLRHDYRNHADYNIDLVGNDPMVTSACATKWLDGHPYFNNYTTSPTGSTTITMSDPSISGSDVSVTFTITDTDNLYQAHFFETITESYGFDDLSLLDCQSLSGSSAIATFTTSALTSDTDSVSIRVMDALGRSTEKKFSVDLSALPSTVVGGETGDDGTDEGTSETSSGSVNTDNGLAEDVNKDGIVNIRDLVEIASNFGQTGRNPADVNGDGVVNIMDLGLVAGAFGTDTAAPSKLSHNLQIAPTRADVQKWLREARQVNLTDPSVQRGIFVLEQLLVALTPKESALLPNYPNPFNPETWIPYELAMDTHVRITIYNTQGVMVRSLSLGHQSAGYYTGRDRAAYWDGRNALGEQVASGLYFYQLETDEMSSLRKMVILK